MARPLKSKPSSGLKKIMRETNKPKSKQNSDIVDDMEVDMNIESRVNNVYQIKGKKKSNIIKMSKTIEDFNNLIYYCKKTYPIYEEYVDKKNSEQQDELHRIEFGDSKYVTKLKNIRIERRDVKDLSGQMKIMVDFYNSNKTVIDKISQLLGEMRKYENWLETRSYYIRVPESLRR